jgi:hypothetical protein
MRTVIAPSWYQVLVVDKYMVPVLEYQVVYSDNVYVVDFSTTVVRQSRTNYSTPLLVLY